MVRTLGPKMKPKPMLARAGLDPLVTRRRRQVVQAPLGMLLLFRRRQNQRRTAVDGVPIKPLVHDAHGVNRGLVRQVWTGLVLISVRPFGPYGCPRKQAPAVCFASCTLDGGMPLRTR